MRRKLRIGCPPDLNCAPLVETLGLPVVQQPPSRLARLLAKGSVDAALVPVVEVFRRGYAHVPGICISSDGPSESVRLNLRAAPQEVRVLALDANSMTSNTLARVVLRRLHGVSPRTVAFDPSRRRGIPRGADAAVTIGDNSLRSPAPYFLDLAEEWKRLTGLPFVFALWAHRRNHPQQEFIRSTLRAALRGGLRLRRRIARREANRLGLPAAFCEQYLTRSIRYRLGPRELKGMARFRRCWSAANIG